MRAVTRITTAGCSSNNGLHLLVWYGVGHPQTQIVRRPLQPIFLAPVYLSHLAGSVRCSFLLIMAIIGAGCGARVEYHIDDVTVERRGWDSLDVKVHFNAGSSLGQHREVEPSAMSVLAFDANYDTLYAGTGPAISLPDTRLGSYEAIVIEACAQLLGHWICDQVRTTASPKRISVTPTIEYPVDDALTRGRYAIDSRVERLSHDGRAEAIDYSGPLHVALEAEVRNAPESRMHIPLPRTEGSFDLARHPGYNDFRYFLDSELMDNDEAFVHFNILAGFRPDSLNSAASVTRHVSPVSRGERHANAQGFARQAARRIAGELTGFLGPRRLELNLESWTFDRSENRYRISMVVSWRRGVFGGVSTRISGELTVGEAGENAMFMLSDGNRDGLERWISRIDGDVLALGHLDVIAPRQRYRPGGSARY